VQEENALSNNLLYQKSLQLSVEFVILAKEIMQEKDYVVIAPLINQVVRSSTSVTANIAEASAFCCSRKDRRFKLSISLKESNETSAWLSILYETDNISSEKFESLNSQLIEVQKMLSKSIKTIDSKM